MSEAADYGPGGLYADGPNTDPRNDDERDLCHFCDELCGSDGRPFIVGLDGRAAHNDCITKWRDDNPVPEEKL